MALPLIAKTAAVYVARRAVKTGKKIIDHNLHAQLIAAKDEQKTLKVAGDVDIQITPGEEVGFVTISATRGNMNFTVPAHVYDDGSYDIHWKKARGEGAKQAFQDIHLRERTTKGFKTLLGKVKRSGDDDATSSDELINKK